MNFLQMMGKGVIAPPQREQLRAISPVALAVKDPSERFREHGGNGHHFEQWNDDASDEQAWAFDRLDCYWAMAPLPKTDVSTLLWGRTRRSCENIITTSPHGLVCVIPGGPQSALRWTTLWQTDGDRLFRQGKPLTPAKARSWMAEDLANGAKHFPVQIEGHVFHQIIEHAPGHLVVVLVDPGWLDPADREVEIAANHDNWRISDRLTGETLGELRQPVTLTVPAGVFRLLDVWRD